jgi:hypothetical protein
MKNTILQAEFDMSEWHFICGISNHKTILERFNTKETTAKKSSPESFAK